MLRNRYHRGLEAHLETARRASLRTGVGWARAAKVPKAFSRTPRSSRSNSPMSRPTTQPIKQKIHQKLPLRHPSFLSKPR